MRTSSLLVLAVVLLAMQVTLFTKAEILGARPDSILILLVYVSLGFGAAVGCIAGFVLGLAQISILSTTIASLPLAGTIIGFTVGKYGTKIMYESYVVQALIIFGAVLVNDTINLMWSSPGDLAISLLRWSLPGALYTAVVGVAVVVVLERIFGLRVVA